MAVLEKNRRIAEHRGRHEATHLPAPPSRGNTFSWTPRVTRQIPATRGSHGVVHDALLTIAQAGEYLGTGERFVRRLVAQRRISYVKLGKYVRLQQSALDAFIESGRVPSE